MGSPLGPILADIFLGHLENTVLKRQISKTVVYLRYMDDIFVIFNSRSNSRTTLQEFNRAHVNIKFTSEHENKDMLPFLDVGLKRLECGRIQRSIYHKPTWTPQYLHYSSFTPFEYKLATIKTIFSRIDNIVSEELVQMEYRKAIEDLKSNAYPEKLITSTRRKLTQPAVPAAIGPEKKRIYLNIPYKGDSMCNNLQTRVRAAVNRTYYAAKLCVIYSTNRLTIPSVKDRLPKMSTSNVIYRFVCDCGQSYFGRTTRQLCIRAREHLPKWAERGEQRDTSSQSAITQHISTTGHVNEATRAFNVMIKPKQPWLLSIYEAVVINKFKPTLCKQLNFVRALLLQW